MQYVRFRHDAYGDFARTERQRKFLKAVVIELLTRTKVTELPKLILFFEPYIETNISDDDMIKLGKLGFEIDRESIDSIQLPPMELIQEKSVNGNAVLYVEPEQVRSYVKSILSDDTRAQSD
ncbi:LCP family protein [Paenibacillus thailandensis]|uniref:LCP family protein n=1 Tax=Paenibacillus thailandensis TaxID=393250 RepID=UPI00364098D5